MITLIHINVQQDNVHVDVQRKGPQDCNEYGLLAGMENLVLKLCLHFITFEKDINLYQTVPII